MSRRFDGADSRLVNDPLRIHQRLVPIEQRTAKLRSRTLHGLINLAGALVAVPELLPTITV